MRLLTDHTDAPVERHEFQTTDLDEAREFLARSYGAPVHVSGLQGPFWHRGVRVGPLGIDDLGAGGEVSWEGEGMPFLVVARPVRGELRVHADGRFEPLAPGHPGITIRPEEEFCVRTADVECESVMIAHEVLRTVAGVVPPFRSGPLEFTGVRPRSQAATSHWYRAVDLVRDGVTGHAGLLTSHPLLVDAMARVLAAAALTVFPNNVVEEDVAEDRGDRLDSHGRVLRRAVAFIEDNAFREIGIEDIAVAARVTPRAVQYAFRRQLGTTPMAYLRKVRLDRAHQELLVARPDDSSVGAVAARWGFVNLGRFAAAYRAAYGENPRTTLTGTTHSWRG